MKKTTLVLTAFLLVFTLIACGNRYANLEYYDSLDDERGYNQNLFFQNNLNVPAADPSVLYIDEGEEAGWFYMYATTDALGATGFYAWRTQNFNDWQIVGPAFVPQRDSWALRNIWAPEVIYMNGKYYMYYSGSDRDTGAKGLGLAVSDHPAGPFIEYGDASVQPLVFDFTAIDASPYLDDDGSFYLYFSKDQVNQVSSIYGVKMIDPATPDYPTLKELSYPTFRSIAEKEESPYWEGDLSWEKSTSGTNMWNEGPFMYKHEGKYYLTYSANPFWTREYAVGYAVADHPLGDFVKPDDNRILGVDVTWDHMSGTGHHSFFMASGELFIAYHAHIDREFGSSLRAVAVDRVFFVGDKLHINGPTYSLQPLPEIMSGYKNVISQASVTVNNSDDDVSKLTDGLVAMHLNQQHYEFNAKAGTTTITIRFEEAVTTRALLIYNSVDYETAFFNINQIVFNGSYRVSNLGFNSNYINTYFQDFPEMRPGGAFTLEYDEMLTDTIVITIQSNQPIAISNIFILGK